MATLPREMLEEVETTKGMAELVEYYHRLQEEMGRLEASKSIARDTLLRAFQRSGLRYFNTDSGLKASVDTRINERISVKEARELLPEELFNKLRQETTIVTLSVRKLKEK